MLQWRTSEQVGLLAAAELRASGDDGAKASRARGGSDHPTGANCVRAADIVTTFLAVLCCTRFLSSGTDNPLAGAVPHSVSSVPKWSISILPLPTWIASY